MASIYVNSHEDGLARTDTFPTSLTSYSVMGWLKLDSLSQDNDQYIFCIRDSGGISHAIVYFNGPQNVRASADKLNTLGLPTQPTLTNWFCWAMTVNGTTATQYLRADGAGSWNTSTSTGTSYTPTQMTIAEPTGSRSVKGYYRYIRIWNSVLSESDLSAEFASATPVKTDTLICNAPCAGSGTAIDDTITTDWTLSGTLGADGDDPTSPVSTVKKLKLLAHPSAQSASSVAGAVFSVPSGAAGSKLTGATRYGEFTGKSFSGTLDPSGAAVLKVSCAAFGGGALTTSDTPVALVRTATKTTGLVSCTVIEE